MTTDSTRPTRRRQLPARRCRGGLTIAVAALCLTGAPVASADPDDDIALMAKTVERITLVQADPTYYPSSVANGAASLPAVIADRLADPERAPLLVDCRPVDCLGDPRVTAKAGERVPVTWVNRNGAVTSGSLWGGRGARDPRPLVIVVPGDTAPEQVYWWAAQVLAAHGYVVLTYDPQGHGRSDAASGPPDPTWQVPAQQAGILEEGGPINADQAGQLSDALDFALSTPASPYVPGTTRLEPAGASQALQARDRQQSRVAAGTSDAYNPLHRVVDARSIGLAGHSRGAYAVSNVGSRDGRVDAIVAWDKLLPGDAEAAGDPSRPVAPRAPALDVVGDYFYGPQPQTAAIDPAGKSAGFSAYRDAGLDAMVVAIRGGTHFEAVLSTDPFFATLRGTDVVSWYTLAWFDRHLRRDPTATRRLLSDRWRADAAGAAVDLRSDGNLFSARYRSSVALSHGPRGRVRCDDLRRGCPHLVPAAADGFPGVYWALDDRS